MRTSSLLKYLMALSLGLPIAALNLATVNSGLAAHGIIVSVAVTRSPVIAHSIPFVPATLNATDDYQPPDNGGPAKTGGSGTRWRSNETSQPLWLNS